MPNKTTFISLFLAVFLFGTVCLCSADTPFIDNGDGTFSLENGIYLRHYDGYAEDSQKFLSVLDACYSMIGSYSEIIDPYINDEIKRNAKEKIRSLFGDSAVAELE